MNYIQKLILRDHPDYDINRHHFDAGDIVRLDDNSIIVVEYSAIEYVQAWVVRKGFKYRELGEQRVLYTDLPYYRKGDFVSELPKISTSIKWKLYDFRVFDDKRTGFLYEQKGHQEFYAFVISPMNDYYFHTKIWVRNPFHEYIMEAGC